MNNYFKFIIYWVVNLFKEEWYLLRLFIFFFLYFKSDMDFICLEKCVDEVYLLVYELIIVGEYLDECLWEIGLKK